LRLGLIKNLATFGDMPTMPDTPLRILHLASWYPSEAHGTLGNFVRRHIHAISSAHSGEVWYAAPSPLDQPLPQNTHTDCGNFQERIVYFKARKPVVHGTTQALLHLAECTDPTPFDLIHLHVAYPAGKAARKLAKCWSIPLVVTEHWTAYHKDQRTKLPFWRKWSMRRTLGQARLICPVSNDLARSIQDFSGEQRFCVVPNVVDTEMFHPQENVNGNAHDSKHRKFRWLHISSLSEDQKNISGIIRAIQHLRKSTDAFHLNIIGDGDPKPHEELVIELGLQDCIAVQGEIPLTEVANQMRRSDALLLFSRYENFPCVIAEAWASGIPVLSSDVGGISEHLTDDRGALVPSEDVAELEQMMRAWILREQAFDGRTLRAHATECFSVAAIAKAYGEAYHAALSTGKPHVK
jgi:glycosyltransferase involved in cell wall biosynthesis